MRRIAAGVAAIVMFGFAVPGTAQQPGDCSTYARNQAETQSRTGRGALGGAMRGAAGGALFGAIIGGRRGAKRGAALGGGLGAIGGGVRASDQRQMLYRQYYDRCMRERR
jgi:predicted lipid-binding transport protein (Tim44 family)